jgi:hypothetical protein
MKKRLKKDYIFDNEGKTFDRFTLITKDGNIFGFSLDPYSPQGFGQFCGEIEESTTIKDYKYLGKRIAFELLNERCKQFVTERTKEESEVNFNDPNQIELFAK